MRYDVVVTRLVNDQPPHIHVRHSRIKPDKVERLVNETMLDEYGRLVRGGSPERISGHETTTGYRLYWADVGKDAAKVLVSIDAKER